MELVYLWVEEYKNIKNQGFNFSPRFTCKYENGELLIEEKKDYVSIFPENINVTAIVGENGSGKSNLLNIIREILYNKKISNSEPNFKYIMILDENTPKIISNFQFEHQTPVFDEFKSLDFYLYLASDQNAHPFVALDDRDVSQEKKHYHRFEQNEYSIAQMLTNKYISNINFHLTTFMCLPNKIDVKVKLQNIYTRLIDKYENPLSYGIPSFDKYQDLSGTEENREFRDARNQSWAKKDDLDHFFEHAKSDFHRFLMTLYIQEFGDENYHEFDKIDFLLEELEGSWYKITEEEFDQYFKDEMKNIDKFSKKEKDIFFNHYKEFFHFDFIDSENRRFNDLSHGEQTIFAQMLNIYYFSLHNKSNLLFFLDEPDLSLHPEWQRKYLSELQNLLIKMEQKFHIIATSHSPFLLSDLSKENVIFLENGKQVYPNIETFGANIHTLLSHGFFMKEGLMGEFAKNKINEVIDYLNGKDSPIENDDEAQRYIHIIGEPIIKRQLQRMLDSKKLDKMKEIDALKSQIESLKNRLENLEKKS